MAKHKISKYAREGGLALVKKKKKGYMSELAKLSWEKRRSLAVKTDI